MKQYSCDLHRRNNETVIPNKIIVEDCRPPDRADNNCRHNNFLFSQLSNKQVILSQRYSATINSKAL